MQYDEYTENQVKHLEQIQAVVGRQAGNSFLVKGWAITVSGAFFGFALSRHDARFAVASVAPILCFGLLDVYFLRTERLFRALYDEVRLGTDPVIQPFFMSATADTFVTRVREARVDSGKKPVGWIRTALSPTIVLLYLALLAASLAAAVLAHTGSASPNHRCRSAEYAARMRSPNWSPKPSPRYGDSGRHICPNPSFAHRGTMCKCR